MQRTFALFLGTLLGLTSLISPVEAYSGYVSDIRFGEHPYEARKRDENRRKRLADDEKEYGRFVFDNPAYLHPLYARRKQLHPYFRKGGVSGYIDGRYARWRGYLDPIRAHAMSPDTYCENFVYSRLMYHGEPVGYQCF